jgi:hypothetical protein
MTVHIYNGIITSVIFFQHCPTQDENKGTKELQKFSSAPLQAISVRDLGVLPIVFMQICGFYR